MEGVVHNFRLQWWVQTNPSVIEHLPSRQERAKSFSQEL